MPSNPTFKNLGALIEQPESGAMQAGANTTLLKVYRATYAVCRAALKTKGTIGSGDLAGFVLEQSTLTPEGNGTAKLEDLWVAGGDDADPGTNPLPPDEVGVSGENQNPRIERHYRYATIALDPATMLNIQKVQQANSAAERTAALAALTNPLARELAQKLLSGLESFYLATLRYTWVTHYYGRPIMTRGGYVQAPGGPLAGYFVRSLSWLRETDDLQYSNGIWRLARTWLAGDGWDADIYQ